MIKLAAIVRRRWSIILVCAAIGMAAGVVSATFADTTNARIYTAEQVVLANNGGSAQDALTVTRGAIPAAAAKKLQTDVEPARLATTMVVTYDERTNALTFTTNDTDKELAVKRVGAFVDAFLETSNDRFQASDKARLKQVEQDIADNATALRTFDETNPQFTQSGYVPGTDLVTTELLAQRRSLTQRAADLESDRQELEDTLAQSAPYTTLGPETPKPATNGIIGVPNSKIVRGAIGAMLGLLLGAVVVMILERLNRRIDTRDELTDTTEIPVLAEISWLPERRRGVDHDGRVSLTGVWAEPYRRVRSAVHFVQSRGRVAHDPNPSNEAFLRPDLPSVFLVTSSSPGEGKSTTSALLAMALAEAGTPTLLVGADFRKPKVDQLIGISSSPSLQDYAKLDLNRPAVDDVVQQTHVRDLYAAASGKGTREVAGLVDATIEVCREAVRRGATIVLDSSPVKVANDTIDLLPIVDYIVLVVRAGVSNEKELLDTIAYLRRLDARILGIVLIGTRSARRRAYYYYDYYSPHPNQRSAEGGNAQTHG